MLAGPLRGRGWLRTIAKVYADSVVVAECFLAYDHRAGAAFGAVLHDAASVGQVLEYVSASHWHKLLGNVSTAGFCSLGDAALAHWHNATLTEPGRPN